MKTSLLTLIGLSCLAVALAAPGLPTGEIGSPAPAAVPTAGGRASMLQGEDLSTGQTVLQRSDDGHFYADVVANGVTSRMLVDTGATVVALTGADAEAMGIEWNPDEVHAIGKGANGAVYGVETKLETVQVGQTELEGVAAVVVPEGLGISLLGQSFLGRLDVEMGPEKMSLGR